MWKSSRWLREESHDNLREDAVMSRSSLAWRTKCRREGATRGRTACRQSSEEGPNKCRCKVVKVWREAEKRVRRKV